MATRPPELDDPERDGELWTVWRAWDAQCPRGAGTIDPAEVARANARFHEHLETMPSKAALDAYLEHNAFMLAVAATEMEVRTIRARSTRAWQLWQGAQVIYADLP